MEAVARPLYLQVREALTARIADGEWKAGEALPSEFALAAQMGVSQGTVRKALDAMAADNLLERRQGRGTFVPEQTEARSLFHFFRMQDAAGAPVVPTTLRHAIERIQAPADVARTLDTGRRQVWRIQRLRAVGGRPAIIEHIYLDPQRFPGLGPDTALPNALYGYYQSAAGVTVARAEDSLSAVAAAPDQAAQLGIAPGAPLLRAHRVARDLRGTAVELRQSWFETSFQHYQVALN
ncbi:GntR family transcriptional regulator [Halovulum dunhuangense]|uniref:GntR family transcriptional regulator n=1 Tax=Halovulum dunhuangense TaxID=1505036 RepID=A0A849L2Q4_9RHOB|nr:GntR family transcriptional regulator [Halovulum dunhuangense]NNU80497.1 GntR family transcriptional regulator [Halovulum dunhuangense]